MTRAEMVAMIRAQLSLNDMPSTWSQEQILRYNQALASYIDAHPEFQGALSDAFLSRVEAHPGDPLVDNSFTSNLSAFGDEFIKQVEEKTTLGFTTLRNLLFVVAIVGTIVFVVMKTKK